MGGTDLQSDLWAAKMLLVRADGCSMCLPLDAVENVFENGSGPDLEVRTWSSLANFEGAQPPAASASTVVLKTQEGPIGLAIEKCLGIRDVSLRDTPPIPTRLVDPEGRPLCHLLVLDGRAYFLLEPRALLARNTVRAPMREPKAGPPAQAPADLPAEG